MNRFLTELSRRNVFRVAAAYVIVGWIALQVASITAPAMNLPEWAVSFVLYVLVIGFPLAMLLTWAFELTPQGVRKIETDVNASSATPKLLDIALLVIAALLVTVTILRPSGNPDKGQVAVVASPDAAQPTEAHPGTAEAPEASIAVLAFANMSGDPENEYFSDGISEEILNALASVKSMRVAARTSAFSFKGQDIDIRIIGETLDVAHVLEGSVRRAGNRVRVTAQLNNAASGYHLWSKTYDRELTDIFAVQEEIALAITQALKLELNIEEKEAISRQGTDNIEAYSAYLKGLEARNALDLYVAVGAWTFFKTAVELDPGFSEAWGGLAMGYAKLGGFQLFSSYEADLAKSFSSALRLDPDDPGGLAAKAFYVIMAERDWKLAGELFDQAMERDASGTIIASYIPNYLYPLGRNNEATALYTETLRRDPLNYGLRREAVYFNSFEGRDNEFALEQLERLIAADEDTTEFSCMKAAILMLLDRDDEALESLARAGPADTTWELFYCAQANFLMGRSERFDASFAKLKDRAADQYGDSIAEAGMYQVIRDFDSWLQSMGQFRTLGDLRILFDIRSLSAAGFDAQASDPRYQALLKAVRLDDASLAEMGMVWGE